MNAALQLLITLTGVTLLFGCAQANGTMEAAARQALRIAGGRAALLPLIFFALSALLAMAGPGAILSTALMAPFAMNTGVRAGVPPFLIALMIGNGSNAGNLSPFSTIGVIVHGLMAQGGLGGHEYRVWFFHASAHIALAAVAYLLFGGLTLMGKGKAEAAAEVPRLSRAHWATLAITAGWMAAVVFWKQPIGWAAFAAAALVMVLRLAKGGDAVRRMPWKTIALVVSISTAVGFLERAGGLNWFRDAIAAFSTPQSVHAVVAAITGAISAYSSTSGVVLPAFLPLVPGLAARLPGTDPLALAITVNIGSAVVDVSPLSTIGALCIAAAPEGTRLYRSLLLWGLAMVPVGALLCYLGAPLFAI